MRDRCQQAAAEGWRQTEASGRINTTSHTGFCSNPEPSTNRGKTQGFSLKGLGIKKCIYLHFKLRAAEMPTCAAVSLSVDCLLKGKYFTSRKYKEEEEGGEKTYLDCWKQ